MFLENGVTTYRRIIVENLTKIEELEKIMEYLTSEINRLEEEIALLENKTIGLEEFKNKSAAMLDAMKEQRDVYKEHLDELKLRKGALENKITSNILVSPNSFRIGVVVFIIILVAAVVVKGREILREE